MNQKENVRYNVVREWMRGRAAEDWNEIFALASSWASDDWAASWPVDGASANRDDIDPPLRPREMAASWLVYGAIAHMPMNDERRTRHWLDEAVAITRAGVRPTSRVAYLALASEGFGRLGDRERAASLAREAEAAAKDLKLDQIESDYVSEHLARGLAPIDLPAALAWLDQVKDNYRFASSGAWTAVTLAKTDVVKAEAVWNHVGDWQAHGRLKVGARDRDAPDVCFRMAQIDLEAARRVAATVKDTLLRVQTQAAIARAVGGDTGKELLRKAVADAELRRMPEDWSSTAKISFRLAWFLPQFEAVDGAAARDLLWEVLSLRPLRPTVESLDDDPVLADAALAQMIARFEPEVARALLEQAVRSLPELDWFQAPQVVGAAACVDPRWAVELLDRLPDSSGDSLREAKTTCRVRAAQMIGLAPRQAWRMAGFWEPID